MFVFLGCDFTSVRYTDVAWLNFCETKKCKVCLNLNKNFSKTKSFLISYFIAQYGFTVDYRLSTQIEPDQKMRT